MKTKKVLFKIKEEDDLFYGRRGHLIDIKILKEPNILQRVAVYNSKTDKITFDNASESQFIYIPLVNMAKDNKQVKEV